MPMKKSNSQSGSGWLIPLLIGAALGWFAHANGWLDSLVKPKPAEPPAVKAKASQITLVKKNEGRTDIALESVKDKLTAKYGPIVRMADHDPKNAAGETPSYLVEAVNAAAGKDSVIVEGKDEGGNVVILLNEPLPTDPDDIMPMVAKVME